MIYCKVLKTVVVQINPVKIDSGFLDNKIVLYRTTMVYKTIKSKELIPGGVPYASPTKMP
jgi:hypothetical protein